MERINVLSQTTPNMSETRSNPPSNEQTGESSATLEKPLDFLALLKWIGRVTEANGQNSEVKSDISEDSSAIQNDNTLIASMGINSFGFTQFLQSYLPVGKDANTGGLSDASKLNIATTSGMIPADFLGDLTSNGKVLDKYRSIITNLLEEMSGNITEIPPSGDTELQTLRKQMNFNSIISSDLIETFNETQNPTNSASKSQGNTIINKEFQQILSEKTNGATLNISASAPVQNQKGELLTTPSSTELAGSAIESGDMLLQKIGNVAKRTLPVTSSDDLANQPAANKTQATLNQNPNIHIKTSKESDELFKKPEGEGNFISNTEITQKPADLIKNFTKDELPTLLNQVANELNKNMLVDKKQVRQFEIQLHPAELGNIKISLRWDNGQVHLQMIASEASTGNNLQQNLSQLRQQLESMGISCGSMEMNQADSGSNWQQPKQENKESYQLIENKKEFSSETYPNSGNPYHKEHLINVTA